MKIIKQKGQNYADFEMRLETVIDRIIYNARNRKNFQKHFNNGTYFRRFKGWAGITRKLWGSLKGLDIHYTGVSHLDAAWLFPVVDTKIRAYKTFYKAIEHCNEFPFLTFSQTTPQYFDWIKHYDPKLFAQVKEAVKKGRIELSGGMWVEPSLDLPNGESLVRQRLYGQLYFLREFGFFPTMSSLLDVFGFPWSLPQILIKSGATSFWTTKDTSGIPMSTCYWQGIDGTQIFMYQSPYNWDSLMSAESFRKKARYPSPEYNHAELNSHLTPHQIEEMFSKKEEDWNNLFGFFYGLGDGGRGPLELEIMFAETLRQMHGGKHGSQHEFIERLKERQGDRYFIWNDEKFLGYHRGVKTTQLKVKHNHRKAEIWAVTAEMLHTLASARGITSIPYEKAQMFEMWRKIMFNEFHDILPGSSIPDVYVLANKELQEAWQFGENLTHKILKNIASHISSKSNNSLLIFNPHSWERSEYIENGHQSYYIENIKPLSLQKFDLEQMNPTENSIKPIQIVENNQKKLLLENDFLTVKIDVESGSIQSIILKSSNVELIDVSKSRGGLGSGLRVFWEDPEKWKAWNLDKRYPLQKVITTIQSPASIQITSDGKSKISVIYQFKNSTATVEFSLRPRDKYLKLHIHTDVKDPRMLVKYFLPIGLDSEEVSSDIPYAYISRKRVKRTPREQAKWEMNMQKWVDISDQTHGLSIFNDNRYGFSATAKGIYLTITRTPEYPGVSPLYGSTRIIPPKDRPKFTDMYPFDFDFGIYPHEQDFIAARVWELAEDFNLPLQNTFTPISTQNSDVQQISELQIGSFISLDNPYIKLTTIKPTERQGEELMNLSENNEWKHNPKILIIRMVNFKPNSSRVSMKLHELFHILRIEEVDLLEMNPKTLSAQENKLSLNFHKFEIKTLRIFFY